MWFTEDLNVGGGGGGGGGGVPPPPPLPPPPAFSPLMPAQPPSVNIIASKSNVTRYVENRNLGCLFIRRLNFLQLVSPARMEECKLLLAQNQENRLENV